MVKTKTHFENKAIVSVGRLPYLNPSNVISSELEGSEPIISISESWAMTPSDEYPAVLYENNLVIEGPLTDDVYLLKVPSCDLPMDLFINDSFVGYDAGLGAPYYYDISSVLDNGENSLVFRVYTEGEDEDFLSSHRRLLNQIEVTIRPKVAFADCYFRTYYDAGWHVKCHFSVRNVLSEQVPLKMKFYIKEIETQEPLATARFVAEETMMTDSNIVASIEQPKAWSALSPDLYTAVLVLTDHLDKEIETIEMLLGFGDIALDEENFNVNGVSTDVKGVVYSLPEDLLKDTIADDTLKQSLKALRKLNVNTLLIKGWVTDKAFYNLCDTCGFYVVNQVPFSYDKDDYASYLEKAIMMAELVKEHICHRGFIIGDGIFDIRTHDHRAFYYEMKERLLGKRHDRVVFDGSPGITLNMDDLALPLIAMELKSRYQPVWFEWHEEERQMMCHKNETIPLEDYIFNVSYYEDGELIDSEQCEKIEAVSEMVVKLHNPLFHTENQTDVEQRLVVCLETATSTWWCGKNEKVAFEQYELGYVDLSPMMVVSERTPQSYEKERTLIVSSGRTSYQLDLRTGALSGIQCNETEYLKAPLQILLNEPYKIHPIETKAVDNYLEVQVTQNVSAQTEGLKITYLFGDSEEFMIRMEGPREVVCNALSLNTTLNFEPTDISYYGYGPHDNGIGHHSFAVLKVHSTDRLLGSRTGLRWLSLVDDKGIGIMVEASKSVPLSIVVEEETMPSKVSLLGDFEEIESIDLENETFTLELKVTLVNDDI